jgi:hypothetical protein
MELAARAGLKAANLSFWRCFARTVTRQTTRRNDKCIHAIALASPGIAKFFWETVYNPCTRHGGVTREGKKQ